MSELLIELLSEEIPVLSQVEAEQAYARIFHEIFNKHKILYSTIKVFSGPRRITIFVSGLLKSTSKREVKIIGPKCNSSEVMIERFCLSNKINKNQLLQEEIKNELHFIYKTKRLNLSISNLLKTIIPDAITKHVWQKSVYLPNIGVKWVRPLKNLLCVFKNRKLNIKIGNLISNNYTFGHKFLVLSKKIKINNFLNYEQELKNKYVIINRQERKLLIEEEVKRIAKSLNLVIKDYEDLLDEVAGLVEYPTVILGNIPSKFLKLPVEVLVSSIKKHQKYFNLYTIEGDVAPYFLFVSNIIVKDYEGIIKGNERVLNARLTDALHFFDQDLLESSSTFFAKIEKLVFHYKIGNIKEKVERLVKICQLINPNSDALLTAARLCKNDLASQIVSEFPELQGVIGYYYAVQEGFSKEIGNLIKLHYKPQGILDNVPTGNAGILALADKVDTVVSLMAAGEKAVNSKDPYSLRRCTLGIIRIILENKLHIDLESIVVFALSLLNKLDHKNDIMLFIKDRLKFYFKDKYQIKLFNAITSLNESVNIVNFQSKLEILRDFLLTQDGETLLITYKRVNNIISNYTFCGSVEVNLFNNENESSLFLSIIKKNQEILDNIKNENFFSNLRLLSDFQSEVIVFFDNVLVNDKNHLILKNRVLLLQLVKQLFLKVLDFRELI